MKNFNYLNAKTPEEAIGYLARLGANAYIVAGATNVMVDIRAGKRNNLTLINIRDIAALKGISYEEGTVRVGALTTITELATSDLIREYAPCLYMAANVFADPTTRNSATIGGNLMRASPAGDTLPPLLVLDAQVHVSSTRGERTLPMNGIFVSLGKTRVEPDELVTAFSFKPLANTAFMKLGQRRSMSIATASAAAYVETDEAGCITDCRIALGSVSATPARAPHAEKALLGINAKDEDAFAAMYEAVQQDMDPLPQSLQGSGAYRREVIPVLVKRAVRKAAFGECN